EAGRGGEHAGHGDARARGGVLLEEGGARHERRVAGQVVRRQDGHRAGQLGRWRGGDRVRTAESKSQKRELVSHGGAPVASSSDSSRRRMASRAWRTCSCSSRSAESVRRASARVAPGASAFAMTSGTDRKSTRLNSSHVSISYAVFCLK